jgi:hypothetical protein
MNGPAKFNQRPATAHELFSLWRSFFRGEVKLLPARVVEKWCRPPETCNFVFHAVCGESYLPAWLVFFDEIRYEVHPISLNLATDGIVGVNLARFDWKLWRFGLDYAALRCFCAQYPELLAVERLRASQMNKSLTEKQADAGRDKGSDEQDFWISSL